MNTEKWQAAYHSAVLEVDREKMPERMLLHVRRLATACRACTVTPTITRRESKSRMR